MKAVAIREHGDTSKLDYTDLPEPALGPSDVLVRVRACALNHLDLWVRRGVPGHTFPLPLIPGSDIVGEVAGLGSAVRGIELGQRTVVGPGLSCGVCEACLDGWDPLCRHFGIFGETRDGGCAQFVAVPARNILPYPTRLDWHEAAAFPLTFLTAWHMLVARAQLRAGETVLVQAGGSGVGSAAIQIAKLHGARVITTAGDEQKLERARELGADLALSYRDPDWVDAVRRFTDKQGVDVVVEHVGPATWEQSLRSLRRGGRLVTCGATTGSRVDLHLNRLFFFGHTILGSTMGSLAEMQRIIQLVDRGALRPVVDSTFPLAEIRSAHEKLEARAAFGKIVVLPE